MILVSLWLNNGIIIGRNSLRKRRRRYWGRSRRRLRKAPRRGSRRKEEGQRLEIETNKGRDRVKEKGQDLVTKDHVKERDRDLEKLAHVETALEIGIVIALEIGTENVPIETKIDTLITQKVETEEDLGHTTETVIHINDDR